MTVFTVLVMIALILFIRKLYLFDQELYEVEKWQRSADLKALKLKSKFLLGAGGHTSGDFKGHQLEISVHNGVTQIILRSKNKGKPDEGIDEELLQETMTLFAPVSEFHAVSGNFKVTAKGQKIIYRETSAYDQHNLQRVSHILETLAGGYLTIVAAGGETAPVLQQAAADKTHPLHKVAHRLLMDIERATKARFAHRMKQTFCLDCMAHFAPHKAQLPGHRDIVYYGCRNCGQSRKCQIFENGVTAVLDNRLPKKTLLGDSRLAANWLLHRAPFDFNRVEIINAGDEDVERFAVQMGNDTDPERKGRYKTIPCAIASDCRLSENTLRILEMTFGEVSAGVNLSGF